MSLPNGYTIQDTTELDKAGASSERDKFYSAARAFFQPQEECGENALGRGRKVKKLLTLFNFF